MLEVVQQADPNLGCNIRCDGAQCKTGRQVEVHANMNDRRGKS